MKQTRITPTLFFDKRGCREGEFSVKYSIYFGTQKMCSTGLILGKQDVQFVKKYLTSKRVPIKDPEQQLIWDMLYGESFVDVLSKKEKVSYLKRAFDVISSLGENFCFSDFKRLVADYDSFLEERKRGELGGEQAGLPARANEFPDDVLQALMFQYKKKYDEMRFSTSDSYKVTVSSLARHTTGIRKWNDDFTLPPLKFTNLTVDFLKGYERWMLKEGKTPQSKTSRAREASRSTIGIYRRNLRTVFGIAMKKGLVSKDVYPFGVDSFIIPISRNVKKARTIEEIGKIINCHCDGAIEFRSRDMWLLSYLSNGANFADILRLKGKDLGNGEFSFIRRKTMFTKKYNLSPVQVYIIDVAQEIIDRWGNPKAGDHEYIFPFLNDEMDEYKIHKTIQQFIHVSNKNMAKIARRLGIRGTVTTYAARHSFSTIMLQSGANMAMISKMLDHRDLTQTQNYFDDFKNVQVKEAVKALVAKKREDKKIEGEIGIAEELLFA